MNQHFKDIVTHGALGFKIMKHSALAADAVVDVLANSEEMKAQFKNVCAPIHISIDNELEELVSILRMSKREFMTMAITSALSEARAIIDEIDIQEEPHGLKVKVCEIVEKDGEKFARVEVTQPSFWIDVDVESCPPEGLKVGEPITVDKRGDKYVFIGFGNIEQVA